MVNVSNTTPLAKALIKGLPLYLELREHGWPRYRIHLDSCHPKPDGDKTMTFTVPALRVDGLMVITEIWLVAETSPGQFEDVGEVRGSYQRNPNDFVLTCGDLFELKAFRITLT